MSQEKLTSTPQVIPLSQIEIGDRRREDYGDIDKLARGIQRVGLLHPLIVQRTNGHFRLVAGGRRFKALESLKAESVEVRLYEDLTEDEIRDIELEENENRKDFTERERTRSFEAAAKVVEDAEKAEEILVQTGQVKTGKKGQPKKPASKAAVAEAIGESRQAVHRAKHHVEVAQQYPFMKGKHWSESSVLHARKLVNKLPAAERLKINDVFELAKVSGGIAPEDAFQILENMAGLTASDREAVYALAKSSDKRERSLALTRAAARPPMPDPRTGLLSDAIKLVHKAARDYPSDPLSGRIEESAKELETIKAMMKLKKGDSNVVPTKARVQ